MLENQSANLQAHFFFQVQTALSLFIINAPHQLPSCYQFWHLTSPNHHAHVTIGPIIRRVRNPPIRKRSHISLQFCWISGQAFGALILRRSRQMVNMQWVGQLQCRLPLKRITKKIVQWKLYSERSTVRRGFIKQIHCLTDGNNLLTYANLPVKMHARH